MEDLTSFDFEGKGVRVVMVKEEAWFVGKDVCGVLGTKTKDIPRVLDIDEKDVVDTIDTIGRKQATTVVSESGLYSLILRSRKPAAKKFKRWITYEVLPTIRKTGAYMTEETLDRAIKDPGFLLTLVQHLLVTQAKLAGAKEELGAMSKKTQSILDKKTATSMARVGHANTKIKKLEKKIVELKAQVAQEAQPGSSPMAVKDIPWLKTYFKGFGTNAPLILLGQSLTALSEQMSYPVGKVYDHPTKPNTYHPDVIDLFEMKIKRGDVKSTVKKFLKTA